MKTEIRDYNNALAKPEKAICDLLAGDIGKSLPGAESKIWHAHPVWFLAGNPVAGYSKLKDAIRLMFWSGASFDEEKLQPGTGKFKDASARYTSVDQVDRTDLKRWLEKAHIIQWDYGNIVKRKGRLEKIGDWQ
jgi:Domain of unknown function (DU1801)